MEAGAHVLRRTRDVLLDDSEALEFAELGLSDMCEDTWRWQSANPMGYKAPESADAASA